MYGVSGWLFFCLFYGFYNRWVDRIAVDLGYTTITMWWGLLGDFSVLSVDEIVVYV